MTRIFVSAGEASGDMHAADLVRSLQRHDAGVELFGMGGTLMADAGVEILFNPMAVSTIGFVEALRNAKVMRRVLQRFGEAMDERKPDVVVCIDFPGFNMKLAEMAHSRGIPCVYYLSPSVWAWGRGRAERLKRLGVLVCAVFPFEEAVFRDIGTRVQFVGHPLLDRVKPDRPRDAVRRELGVSSDELLIALLPGSRRQELTQLLPPMLKAAAIVRAERPHTSFVVPVSHTLSPQQVTSFLPSDASLPVAIVEGRTYDMLAAADAGIVGLGTATLEAALLGLPHVSCYKVSGTTYTVGRMIVKTEHLALPNIIAKRRIVPELVQSDVTGAKLAASLLPMLDEPMRTELQQQLSTVRTALGKPGAADRVANIVLTEAAGG